LSESTVLRDHAIEQQPHSAYSYGNEATVDNRGAWQSGQTVKAERNELADHSLLPPMVSPDGGINWQTVLGYISSISAAFFAARKLGAFIVHKLGRFFRMPDTIEALANETNTKIEVLVQNTITTRLDELSDQIALVDGRSKIVESNHLDIPFMELNAAGFVEYVSSQAAQVLGRPRDECAGNNWWNAIYGSREGSTRERLRDRWVQCTAKGELFEEEVMIGEDKNSLKPVRIKIVPITNHNGKLLGWKALFTKRQVAP
jgi:PAS domain-containing protein